MYAAPVEPGKIRLGRPDDSQVTRRKRQRAGIDGLADVRQHDVAGGRSPSADNDQLRVEHVHYGCHDAADEPAGPGQQFERDGVPVLGRPRHVLRCQRCWAASSANSGLRPCSAASVASDVTLMVAPVSG